MAERDDFLRAVAERLPFGAVERNEILEELLAHVEDSTAGLAESGLTRPDAEHAAIERLGPPERLADELVRSRRSGARLLAAAGAGAVTIVGTGIYGLLLGFVVAVLASLVAMLALTGLSALGRPAWLALGNEFNVAVEFLDIGIACYLVGRNVTPVIAERAGYSVLTVRRVVAALGAVLIGGWALAGRSGPLDGPSLVVLLSLPAWWLAGAWHGRRLFGARDAVLRPVVFGLVAAIALTLVLAAVGGTPGFGASVGGGAPDWDVDRIAPAAPDAVQEAMVASSATLWDDSGRASISMVIDRPSVLDGWTGLRIEAWRALAPTGEQPTLVDPDAAAPFATGPVGWTTAGAAMPADVNLDSSAWSSTTPALTGSLDLRHWPGIAAAWFAITGVGPDGVRRTISGAEYGTLTFNGTALGWLAAVVAGR